MKLFLKSEWSQTLVWFPMIVEFDSIYSLNDESMSKYTSSFLQISRVQTLKYKQKIVCQLRHTPAVYSLRTITMISEYKNVLLTYING